MTVTIEIDKKSFDGIDNNIKNKIRLASDLSGPMKKAGLLLFKDVQKHFDREEGPDGKWKPLSPKTANAFVTKNKRRGYQHILVNTGQLKGSFLHDATKFSARTYSQIADKNYGIQHEQGTKFIPQRRFMWMSDEAKENIIEVLKMHFQSEN